MAALVLETEAELQEMMRVVKEKEERDRLQRMQEEAHLQGLNEKRKEEQHFRYDWFP